MTIADRTVTITGAYGYLGSRIRAALLAAGWRVSALVRQPRPEDKFAKQFELEKPLPRGLLGSEQLLVHCAYDLTLTRRRDVFRVNVDGTRRLLQAAREAGVQHIIVLSSMSAYEGTTQIYGQAKLAIEQATHEVGGCAVRPGLVYGDRPGGMAGALRKLTRLPVVPLLGANTYQFVVHEDDFASAIVAIAGLDELPPGPIGIAPAEPLPFRRFLEGLAADEGRRCHFVPVPWHPVYGLLRTAELVRLHPPFRADSVIGLVKPARSVEGADYLAELGVHFRPFAARRPSE